MNLRPIVCSALAVLCMSCLSSCTQLSLRFWGWGQKYNGVEMENNTIYRSGKAFYVKGRRVQYREFHELIFYGKEQGIIPVKISGTEGETVYRRIRNERKRSRYYQSEEWDLVGDWEATPPQQPLVPTTLQHRYGMYQPTSGSQRSAHAIWAYPMAALSLVAVDIPTGVASVCYGLFIHPLIPRREQPAP